MKKQVLVAIMGIAIAGVAIAAEKAEKTSPEAKEVHAAKFISCVNAKVTKAAPATDLNCEHFKNLDKAVEGYKEGKKPRGLSAAAGKLEKADLAGLSDADKKLIEAAKATEIYKKIEK